MTWCCVYLVVKYILKGQPCRLVYRWFSPVFVQWINTFLYLLSLFTLSLSFLKIFFGFYLTASSPFLKQCNTLTPQYLFSEFLEIAGNHSKKVSFGVTTNSRSLTSTGKPLQCPQCTLFPQRLLQVFTIFFPASPLDSQ